MSINVDSLTCTGCGTCSQICPNKAIRMEEGKDGFLYPVVDDKACIQCGKCELVCPVSAPPQTSSHSDLYAAYNCNEIERLKSTSGGLFILFAKTILSKGGIVYGAAYDENQRVVHIGVTDESELETLQGAKYAQSDLGDVFCDIKNDLVSGRYVLFAGTPCQVAGLVCFLGKDYDNLLLIDFVCHGVPSAKAWDSYLHYRRRIDSQNNIAMHINMRSKDTGWSHYKYSIVLDYDSGYKYAVKNGGDLYMESFVKNMIIRQCCGNCSFKGVHRSSDVTLGDFWGIWDLYPEMDDNKGTSVLLVHSDKGRCLWEVLRENCKWIAVNDRDTYIQNPAIIQSSQLYRKRDSLLHKMKKDSFAVFDKELHKRSSVEQIKKKGLRLLRRVKHSLEN